MFVPGPGRYFRRPASTGREPDAKVLVSACQGSGSLLRQPEHCRTRV